MTPCRAHLLICNLYILDLDCRPVPKEAPAGLFFTKAAFLKYSALARVREASVSITAVPVWRCLFCISLLHMLAPISLDRKEAIIDSAGQLSDGFSAGIVCAEDASRAAYLAETTRLSAFLLLTAQALMQAARRHDQPSLPKPLGPLPGSLTRAALPRARSGLTERSKDGVTTGTQDAVVPELQTPGVASLHYTSNLQYGLQIAFKQHVT